MHDSWKKICLTVAVVGATFFGGNPGHDDAQAQEAPTNWLQWPVDCVLGDDCYISRYVDHDTSTGVQDFRCRGLAGNGHRGTDIAVQDLIALSKDVAITAAAAGRVIVMRDGMADQLITPEAREAIQSTACGNNIALLHENGLITRYCHLKQGSLTHQRGDIVSAGDVIGRMGLSGDTNFPHLHFSVQSDGNSPIYFDPFTAKPLGTACSALDATSHMWEEPQRYRASDVVKAVFYGGALRPRHLVIQSGQHEAALASPLKQLHAFFVFYGANEGVTVQRRLTLPTGRTLSVEPLTFDDWAAQRTLSLSYGKKDGSPLPLGRYSASFDATAADGTLLWQHSIDTVVY